MRVKCPNADVFLELPNDRTDMKFNCPACKRVHRVRVVIGDPADDTRALAVPTPPKKYATGAYPPVVDVPIDAHYVMISPDQTPNTAERPMTVNENAPENPDAPRREPLRPPLNPFPTGLQEAVGSSQPFAERTPPAPEESPASRATERDTKRRKRESGTVRRLAGAVVFGLLLLAGGLEGLSWEMERQTRNALARANAAYHSVT